MNLIAATKAEGGLVFFYPTEGYYDKILGRILVPSDEAFLPCATHLIHNTQILMTTGAAVSYINIPA